MFVRSIFAEPINGAAYNATWRILMKDQATTDLILDQYPAMCRGDLGNEKTEEVVKQCTDNICSAIGGCSGTVYILNFLNNGGFPKFGNSKTLS